MNISKTSVESFLSSLKTTTNQTFSKILSYRIPFVDIRAVDTIATLTVASICSVCYPHYSLPSWIVIFLSLGVAVHGLLNVDSKLNRLIA